MLLLGTELSVAARVAWALIASSALWFAHHHRACSLLAGVALVPWGLASLVGTSHCHTLPLASYRDDFIPMMGLASDKDREPGPCCQRGQDQGGLQPQVGRSESAWDRYVQFHPACELR